MSEQYKEREINIFDMFWEICSKWRLILLGALVCAILAGFWNINRKAVQESANDVELTDEELAQAQLYYDYITTYNQWIEYNAQSLKMRLNSNGFYKGNLTFYVDNYYSVEYPVINKTNKINGIVEAYKSILSSEMFRDELIASGALKEEDVPYLDEVVTDGALVELVSLEELVATGTLTEKDALYLDSSANSNTEDVFSINIYGQDIESCNKIMTVIKEQMATKAPAIQQQFGEHELTLMHESCNLSANVELLTFQRENISKANTYLMEANKLYTSLPENVKSYVDKHDSSTGQVTTDEITKNDKNALEMQQPMGFSWKMLILGFVAGAMVVVIAYVIAYVFNSKLRIEDEFEDIYGLKLLGNIVIANDKKKKWFHFIDCFIARQRHRNKRYFPEKEAVEMVAAGIRIAAKKANFQQIYITGSVMLEKEKNVAEKLADILKADAIEVIIGNSILYDAESMEKNAEIGNVVLMETADASLYNEIAAEIQNCVHQDVNILGAIVVA